ncbi:MAG: transglycosylase SLT domain-containing protein [Candidatus Melainabacteria bacterium]|nr:transglycosylase SLT domain-containing protein [Candidatus Melainabacteria bacterium]
MKLKLNLALVALLLLVFLVPIQFLFNPQETIPDEKPIAKEKLLKGIRISKVNTEEAINYLENLKDLPKYTDYKRDYLLARLYERKNNYNKSILIYEKLLSENYPFKERVIFHYANLNTLTNNDKVALVYFKKLIHDFPSSKSIPQSLYYLAQTLMRLKLNEKAIETLVNLKSKYPNTQYGIATNYYLGEFALYKNNFEETLSFWRKYLEESPDGRFANEIADILKGNLNFKLNSYDFSLLGDVFYHKKDYKNSIYFYKLANNPKDYFNLGYSLFRLARKSEAKNYFYKHTKNFPKAENAKLSLLYASRCIPSFMQRAFWAAAKKDIPELISYTKYKEAILEESKRKKEELLREFISTYPESEFILDSVWEIMWQKIQDKDYASAKEIGEKYSNLKSDTSCKIGFWLGKIEEITNQKLKAIECYKKVSDLLFDNYYSFRARARLLALTGGEDIGWKQKISNHTNNVNYTIPPIIKPETIKSYYGATVLELINIQEFNEAIDLIGINKSASKKTTSWLKALNGEYESSINTAALLLAQYNLKSNNSLWKLAYPLYFWELIDEVSKDYLNIDPFLICSLIRQESRFDKDAKSISGALGLMQLIPPTARTVSRQKNINLTSLELLQAPQINILLGTHYLNGLISDFNNPLFAVSSYNAGPVAVKNWIYRFNKEGKDLDFFVEEIPYNETRNYVKKVFANYWTYLRIYAAGQT